ncbi:MAG: hypothetical protein AAF401_09210 [Pseudomonadota bacterium]
MSIIWGRIVVILLALGLSAVSANAQTSNSGAGAKQLWFDIQIESHKSRMERRVAQGARISEQIERTRPTFAANLGLVDRREVIVDLTYLRTELEQFRGRLANDEELIDKLAVRINTEKAEKEAKVAASDSYNASADPYSPEARLKVAKQELAREQETFKRNQEGELSRLNRLMGILVEAQAREDGRLLERVEASGVYDRIDLIAGTVVTDLHIATLQGFIQEVEVRSEAEWLNWAYQNIETLEAEIAAAGIARQDVNVSRRDIPAYDGALNEIQSIRLQYESMRDQAQADAADVDQYITDFIANADTEAQSTWMVAAIFFLLMAAIIWQLFHNIGSDPEIKKSVFANDAALQFVALLSIIIAIIIFGITKILGGNELSALLGSIAGYILGRSSDKLGNDKNKDKPDPA